MLKKYKITSWFRPKLRECLKEFLGDSLFQIYEVNVDRKSSVEKRVPVYQYLVRLKLKISDFPSGFMSFSFVYNSIHCSSYDERFQSSENVNRGFLGVKKSEFEKEFEKTRWTFYKDAINSAVNKAAYLTLKELMDRLSSEEREKFLLEGMKNSDLIIWDQKDSNDN